MNMMIATRVRTSALAFCCLAVFACADDNQPSAVGVVADVVSTDVTEDTSDTGDALDATGADVPVDIADGSTPDVAADTAPDADSTASQDAEADTPTEDTAAVDIAQDGDGETEGDSDVTEDSTLTDTATEDVPPLEGVPAPGELLITEIMANPDGIADGDGEWFELVNLAAEPVDLAHCKLHDGGIDSFPLSFSVSTLPMEPGERWVLGPNDDESSNGGVQVDVLYSDFYLSNQSDEIRISCAGTLVEEVIYDASWQIEPGVAMSFDSAVNQDTVTNDAPIHWCGAQSEYFAGNAGSPGLPNEACPIPDTEVDACVLTAPAEVSVVEGEALVITGLLYDEGDTDVTPGLDELPLLLAQAGWGVAGTEPETWTWIEAAGDDTWNDGEMVGYDQYSASIAAPELGGYSALFRFSLDSGATWTTCDLSGSEDGLSMEDAGSFTTVEDPCLGASCGEAPEAECQGDVYVIYSGVGSCAVEGVDAVCVFDEASEDCATTGGTCTPAGCEGGATTPLPGELVITEIMNNPSAVSDGKGEWFEAINVTEGVLLLEGCSIQGGNDTPHVITTDGAFLAPAGEELLFVRNPDSATNGGVSGEYAYDGVTLGNSEDSLSIHCGDALIDEVIWDDGATFPDPAGASMQLDAGSFDAAKNDSGDHWCVAEADYGELGDLGTPGTPNQLCDPCLDVVCDEAPAPTCDGDLVEAFEAAGVCDQGACVYEPLPVVDCSESEETCVSGACMTPCAYFCELSDAICLGGLAVDFGDDSCEEACAKWEVGSPDDQAVDTTWCRIGYLAQGLDVVPATACAAAAVDGGQICVNPPTTCELYCELAPQACQNDQEIVFPESDCPTVCATWAEGEPDDMLADTAWCRLNHLQIADEAPGLHCAAATPDGGETCIDHCVDVVCDPAPAPLCEGSVSTSYSESVCDEGVCVSEPQVQDCALTEQLCEDGVCVSPPTLCSEYCGLVATTCFEADAIDFGDAGCEATCEAWPVGDENDMANGTTWCRINQLQSDSLGSEEACAIAGQDGGGVCVTTVVALVINEFDYDQVSVDSSEFVELYNPTDTSAFLADYTLVTLNGAGDTIHTQFPLESAGSELEPGAYLVVGVQALLDTLPPEVLVIPAPVDFVQNAGNGGDAIGIFHNDGPTVDTVSYGGTIPGWTEGDGDAGVDPGEGGLSRCPNGEDGDSNEQDFSWVQSLTPGAQNSCEVETP